MFAPSFSSSSDVLKFKMNGQRLKKKNGMPFLVHFPMESLNDSSNIFENSK